MARVKATYVPLSDRTFINGTSELMGYLGVDTPEKLNRDYIDKGLYPKYYEGTRRWRKADVDRWIDEHDQWQSVKVRK